MSLRSPAFRERFKNFNESVDQGHWFNSATDANKSFTEIIIDCAKESTKQYNNLGRSKKSPNKKWFSKDCQPSQKLLHKSLQKLNRSKRRKISVDPRKLHDLVTTLYTCKKAHRSQVTRSRRLFERKLNQDIECGKIVDWKKFKNLKSFHEPVSPLGLDDLLAFELFFKKLYEKKTPITPQNRITAVYPIATILILWTNKFLLRKLKILSKIWNLVKVVR